MVGRMTLLLLRLLLRRWRRLRVGLAGGVALPRRPREGLAGSVGLLGLLLLRWWRLRIATTCATLLPSVAGARRLRVGLAGRIALLRWWVGRLVAWDPFALLRVVGTVRSIA